MVGQGEYSKKMWEKWEVGQNLWPNIGWLELPVIINLWVMIVCVIHVIYLQFSIELRGGFTCSLLPQCTIELYNGHATSSIH